jgi:glycosyltransferase involved in cell wall biosynthesis
VPQRARRFIFVNRFFAPDHSATGQLLGDLSCELARRGHHVQVVTSRQRYDAPDARLPSTALVDGVSVHRVSGTRFGRGALLGRGLDLMSFQAAAWRRVRALARAGDVMVAMTDPPLACVPAMHVAASCGALLVNWLQDLYPEVAIELGVPLLRGPLAGGLGRLRDRALRAAAANVVVGERMAGNLLARGIAAERLHVIANWCDDEEVRPIAHRDNPLRRAWRLEGNFVLGYSGNLGRAHEYDTVLGAAERLRDDPRIIFLLIGGGRKFDELAGEVRARRLGHLFRFMPYQDRSQLRNSLGVADVHWVSLQPGLEGLAVPSKIYGAAAAGRPIIAVAAPDGEIASLVRRHDCGFVVKPGQADALVAALTRLRADPIRATDQGRRARAMLDGLFTRRRALERWANLLAAIA